MSIYRVALCEDDALIRSQLCDLCADILKEWSLPHTIGSFSSAEELNKYLAEHDDPFDVLLLDIQMEGLSGMELAQELRDQGNRISIIFVSGCEDYLLKGYEVQPVYFLLKPVERGAMEHALRTDWQLNHRPKTIVLYAGSKSITLEIAQICYAESYNHEILVHLTQGADRLYSLPLWQLEKQLPSDQFCRCHKSYLVNLSYIESLSRTQLVLRGGHLLPIGRTYYKSLQSAFIRYMNQ